jgi:hypothetical protein
LQSGKRKKNVPWVLSFAIIETEEGRNGRNGSAEKERERRQAENRVAGVLEPGDRPFVCTLRF